jgi:hypothetical protein
MSLSEPTMSCDHRDMPKAIGVEDRSPLKFEKIRIVDTFRVAERLDQRQRLSQYFFSPRKFCEPLHAKRICIYSKRPVPFRFPLHPLLWKQMGDNDQLPSWSTCIWSRMSWVRIPPAQL